MIRKASQCLMLKWINNIEKLDVLSPSQLALFVEQWNQFELNQYLVSKKTITSLTIDSVSLNDSTTQLFIREGCFVRCYYGTEDSYYQEWLEMVVDSNNDWYLNKKTSFFGQ